MYLRFRRRGIHVTHVVEEALELEAWMGQRTPGLQEGWLWGCQGLLGRQSGAQGAEWTLEVA